MADASQTQIAYGFETTWGDPSTAGSGTRLRYTASGLRNAENRITSAEITPDREPPDAIRADVNAEGNIDIEWSSYAFEDFLEGAMHVPAAPGWTTLKNITPGSMFSISGANPSAGTGTLNDDAALGDKFDGLQEGDWIEVGDWTSASLIPNNGWMQVLATPAMGANSISVGGRAFVDGATGANHHIKSRVLRIGTTARSFTIEQRYPRIAGAGGDDLLQIFPGMRVNTAELRVAPGELVTGSFTFLGKIGDIAREDDANYPRVTNASGGSIASPLFTAPGNAFAHRVFSAITDMKVYQGAVGLPLSDSVTEATITINNNLRTRAAVGTLGAVQVGLGTVEITGTINVYFDDKTMIDDFLGDTLTNVSIVAEEAPDNLTRRGMVFAMESVVFNTGDAVIPGQNQDVIQGMGFNGQKDATTLRSLQIFDNNI